MKKKIMIILGLIMLLAIDTVVLGKGNKGNSGKGNSSKSSSSKSESSGRSSKSEKSNKTRGNSEIAKKNWGQLKEDSYASEEERTMARIEIQHKHRLRMLISAGDLEYPIDSDEEYAEFLIAWYNGEIEVSEELQARFEEEFAKLEEKMQEALENSDEEEEDDDEAEEDGDDGETDETDDEETVE